VAAAAVAVLAPALTSGGGPVQVSATLPSDGASLDRPPAEVAVDLTDVVAAREYHLTVVPDGGGPPVTTGGVQLAETRLQVPVAVGPGGYQAAYHVWLADGRQLSGMFRFTVGGSGPAEALPGGAPAGHAHGGDDPLNAGLLVVDLLLVAVVLGLLARMLLRRRHQLGTNEGASRGRA
jgi:methionine-rich copper-binding protein CopC